MTRKGDVADWALNNIGSLIGLGCVIAGLVLLGPPISQGIITYDSNVSSWDRTHAGGNCGYLLYCVDHNATVTSVRDYTVECDTWFSTGTCPRENLGFSAGFNQTINCHYYAIGDKVVVTEKFDYYPATNTTKISWSLKGGPC